ncbi:MAG: PAS domain-containing protein, partial [Candidatus Thermoplasmatota archaeon]|nr:PAS domain-containing protein [Candidatus Thermoplasmatota archaeon]
MASKKKGSKKTEAVNENIIRDERYRLLFEASQDAIMFLDRERFFDCNPATLKMFGLTKEEFIKRHPSEISPPRQSNGKTSREEADRRIAEAFTEGTNKFEWIHRRSSGEDFAATVWLTAFPLEGRDVLQATVREISPSDESLADLELHRLKLQMLLDEQTKGFVMEKDDRKRAEKEVKRLIKAVESSINAVAFFDMDLNFIYANNALCRLARIERDDLKNRNASDFIPPKSMKVIMENIRRLIDGQEIEVFEVKSLTAQGQELWIEIAGSVLFSDLGEPEGLLAIINDVTERKRIQKALEESEEKFKSLVERSLDGILIILDGKVAYMNPALIKLSGYSLKEQLGRDFIENVAPEARQDVMVKYKSRMAGGNVPQIYETILMAKDGTRIPIEVNAGVMEFLGEPADFVYLRDLTERRKAMDDFRIIKDRLEYVLGATKTGYDIIDPDYNVVYVDPAWTKTLGDYQGKKCYEYFKGMKKPCNICGIQEALKSKKTIVTEEYLMKENRYTEVHTIPFE